jgi:hypothetical protein
MFLIIFSISGLVERKLRETYTMECVICFGVILTAAVAVGGQCVHAFHKECVHRWFHEQLPNTPTCPHCREPAVRGRVHVILPMTSEQDPRVIRANTPQPFLDTTRPTGCPICWASSPPDPSPSQDPGPSTSTAIVPYIPPEPVHPPQPIIHEPVTLQPLLPTPPTPPSTPLLPPVHNHLIHEAQRVAVHFAGDNIR